MEICLFNAIKTPDGTILHCQKDSDYKEYTDTISGEKYMNDGLGFTIRRSINKVPYEDLAVFTNSPFEKIRAVKFWASYGKDGKSEKKYMSLEEMEKSHIEAILRTQTKIKNTPIEKIFIKELEYRIQNFKNELETIVSKKNTNDKKLKI